MVDRGSHGTVAVPEEPDSVADIMATPTALRETDHTGADPGGEGTAPWENEG